MPYKNIFKFFVEHLEDIEAGARGSNSSGNGQLRVNQRSLLHTAGWRWRPDVFAESEAKLDQSKASSQKILHWCWKPQVERLFAMNNTTDFRSFETRWVFSKRLRGFSNFLNVTQFIELNEFATKTWECFASKPPTCVELAWRKLRQHRTRKFAASPQPTKTASDDQRCQRTCQPPCCQHKDVKTWRLKREAHKTTQKQQSTCCQHTQPDANTKTWRLKREQHKTTINHEWRSISLPYY